MCSSDLHLPYLGHQDLAVHFGSKSVRPNMDSRQHEQDTSTDRLCQLLRNEHLSSLLQLKMAPTFFRVLSCGIAFSQHLRVRCCGFPFKLFKQLLQVLYILNRSSSVITVKECQVVDYEDMSLGYGAVRIRPCGA